MKFSVWYQGLFYTQKLTDIIKKIPFINFLENPNLVPLTFFDSKMDNWDFLDVLDNSNNFRENIFGNPNMTLEMILKTGKMMKKSTETEPEIGLSFRWILFEISRNPNITMSQVLNHPELPWSLRGLSKNPNLSMNMVLNYPETVWRWEKFFCHPSVLREMRMREPTNLWNWWDISSHSNITMEDILQHPELPFDDTAMCYNPNITLNFLSRDGTLPRMNYVSQNPSITINDVKKYPNDQNGWFGYSTNVNLRMKDILENYEKSWNWMEVSRNPNISLKDILEHPELPWDWEYVSENPSITVKEMLDNPLPLEKSWDIPKFLSKGLSISDIFLFFKNNPTEPLEKWTTYFSGNFHMTVIFPF